VSAWVAVSSCCAAYAAFACLHAASLERLPEAARPRVTASRWRAGMYVASAALLGWALLLWSRHETVYAALCAVSSAAMLAATLFVLLRARWPRALWGSALVALLGALAAVPAWGLR
jgi:hypothetical protein